MLWPLSGRSGAAGSAAFEGRQAKRGGDRLQAVPLEGKRSAQRRRRGGIDTGRSRKKGAPPRGTTHRMLAPRDQFVAGDTIDCNCSITPGSTNTHGWLAAIGTLNTSANTSRFRWASRPVR